MSGLLDFFKNRKRTWQLYLLITPVLIYYIIFHYAPMYGIQIAFRDFMPSRGFVGSEWVGLKHFQRFFSSYYFKRILLNTIMINLYSLLVGFPVPILFALLLNEIEHKIYEKLVQNVTYIPHFLSAVVVVSILQLMLNPNMGVVNMALEAVGLSKKDFLTDAPLFKHIYVWSGIWQNMGWNSIIYIAALSGVNPSLYEAATIDGASRLQKMRYISIPGIMPTIVILFILRCGAIMNIGFEKILLMQNDLNMESSDVISTFVYRSGILGADYSFSAAVGLFNSVCNFILLIITNSIVRRLGEVSLW